VKEETRVSALFVLDGGGWSVSAVLRLIGVGGLGFFQSLLSVFSREEEEVLIIEEGLLFSIPNLREEGFLPWTPMRLYCSDEWEGSILARHGM
jgi:hypothetical protein